MAHRFFLSLTTLSFILSCQGFTEEEKPQTLEETPVEQPPAPQKRKPHFVGVKKAPESKPISSDPQKKPRKIKNQWFSSKTQLKSPKKEKVKEDKDAIEEVPSDLPYFQKTTLTVASSQRAQPVFAQRGSLEDSPRASSDSPREAYPRTGFQAPCGHLYFTGEWLYWRTRQEGMEFATSRQMTFDFQSGFRVGIGTHLPSFDGWEIDVNYTYFNPKSSRSSHGSFYPLFLFQGSGVSGNSVTTAHGHWNIRLQSLDVALGKPYYLTKTLVFNPFFGLKGLWIDQDARFHYQGGYIPAGQTFRTRFENDFKGAGPLIGTEINWQLGAGFGLFADAATSLVVGHFNNEQDQDQPEDAEVVDLGNDFHLVSPMLQMVAGISWDRNFHKEQFHVGLSAGFESQYFWSQNQTEQFTADTHPTYVRQRGDLSVYGLTLRGRFDF